MSHRRLEQFEPGEWNKKVPPSLGWVQPRRPPQTPDLEDSKESTADPSPPAAQIESNYDETIDSFDDMALKSELVRGVHNHGFERPSAVQQRVIAPVIKGERSDGGDGQTAHRQPG